MSEIDLPSNLREIVEDFRWSEGQEKLQLLLQYAEQLPPLPEWLEADHGRMEPVPECMTPVFVQAELKEGRLSFFFDIPRSSPTVRGFASLLSQGLNGATPQDVLGVPVDFYLQLGLEGVLSHQRLNGLTAILAHMKALAVKHLPA